MQSRFRALFITLAAMLLAACQPAVRPANMPASVPAPTIAEQPLPTDTQVLVGTLPNGLRYYIRHNNEPRDRVELRLVVNAGSVLEDADQLGLAHLVEHMAFNGTRNFAEHELVGYLESVGMRFGPDVNAYTGFDETVYMLTLPTDSAGVVATGLQILEDWAHGITFDSAAVAGERGVVIEEWRLGQGAGARLRDRQFPVLFAGSRYAERLPIGTRASLEGFDPAALRRFYRDWYRPELMAVVAVGDIDPMRMREQIRERFGSIPASAAPRERPDFDVPAHERTRVSVATDAEATGSSISLYLKQPARPTGTAAAFRRWAVESLASAMLNDRLNEITQKPDAPLIDVSSFQGRMLRPIDAFVLNAAVPDGGIERGVRALLSETNRAARLGFTATELERQKTELLRSMQRSYAERDRIPSAQFAGEYASHFLYGGALLSADTEWALYQRSIPDVSLDEVNAAARGWMGAGSRVILATAPATPDVPVPAEAALAAVVEEAGAAAVVAYTDSVSGAPLLPSVPAPAGITAERTIPEIGVTEWTLANGARVILKPTDFKDDEILLAARSPGGTSLVPDRDYIPALTATAAVQVGGVGAFNAVELGKRLAGKAAGVGVSIGELEEGLSGTASPADVETLFQLVYLYFTAPREDSTAFLAYEQRARAMLRNRSASPDVAFEDTLRVTLAQGHPRAAPPSAEMFDGLDLERSFRIYRDRFADAGDFTFYLVGSFRPEQLRPLVQRYLATLPSTGREETWRDPGIRPPTGVIRKTVRQGSEPKGQTRIVFTGPLQFDRANLHALSAMADVLQLRLRETLREELSGTYGVGVGASGSRDPIPSYRVSIGFGASPERLDELTRVVFEQIDRLQRDGPSAADLAKVREIQLREREVHLRENNFWLTQLISYDRLGWDPRVIPEAAERIRSIDARAVQQAARQYLNTANYVQVSLVPEAAPAAPGTSAAPRQPRATGVHP